MLKARPAATPAPVAIMSVPVRSANGARSASCRTSASRGTQIKPAERRSQRRGARAGRPRTETGVALARPLSSIWNMSAETPATALTTSASLAVRSSHADAATPPSYAYASRRGSARRQAVIDQYLSDRQGMAPERERGSPPSDTAELHQASQFPLWTLTRCLAGECRPRLAGGVCTPDMQCYVASAPRRHRFRRCAER